MLKKIDKSYCYTCKYWGMNWGIKIDQCMLDKSKNNECPKLKNNATEKEINR